jgi:putative NADPH-quinone reductase
VAVSLILAHPDPQSFNHALAHRVALALEEQGREVWFHDLYAEGFDPLLPAAEIPKHAPLPSLVDIHVRQIVAAEGIVIVHPNWWGMPPAILAGWVDRVFRPEAAYRFLEGDGGEGAPQGLLQARAAVVLNTANTDPERERTVFGDPLEAIWRSCVFGLCGVSKVIRRTFSVVVTSTLDQRKAWLEEAARLAVDALG